VLPPKGLLLAIIFVWVAGIFGSVRVSAQVATPTLIPNGGNSYLEESVIVSCATSGATIHYTTNGVTPTSSDRTVLSGGTVLIDRPLTLQANASKSGLTTSPTASASFSVSGKLAAGATHSVALRSDGTIWSWGGNASGQLGIGITDGTAHAAPIQSKLNSATFLSGMAIVAAGASHSLAVQSSDGSVFGWGLNSSGQLGDNSITTRSFPVQAKTTASGNPVLTGITDVAGGAAHTIALKSDGTVWTWGVNTSGQLGDGTTTTRKLAAQVLSAASTPLTGVIAVGAGDNFCAALKSDGTVWTWGVNASGQLGIGSTTTQKFAVQVTLSGGGALSGVADVACGSTHVLALKTDGTVWSWGANTNGQLGVGGTTQANNPVQVKASSTTFFGGVAEIVAGASHSILLKTDGTVYGCGLNTSGQLSINSTTQQLFPFQAISSAGTPLSGVVDLACGASHTLFTGNNGTVYGCGLNSLGEAGYPTTTVNPAVGTPISNFFIISAFGDPDGDGLATWRERELGTNPLNADTDGDGMSDGWEVSHGLNPLVNDASADPDGDGFTNLQEFTNGTDPFDYYNGGTPSFVPVGGSFPTEQTVTVNFVTPGATINYTTNGLTPTTSDRSVIAGGNILIDRPVTLKANASKVGLASTATTSASYIISGRVAAGASHSVGLKSEGTVWTWGANASGQLGVGTTDATAHAQPVQVKLNSTTFLTGMSSAGAGASHSLAVRKSDGSVFGWGSDSAGQLGDNSAATSQSFPVQAKTTATGNPILTGITAVAGGLTHSVALKSDGTVWAWGSNASSQLGDGGTTSRKLAAQVLTAASTPLTGVIAIRSGDNFCAALKSDGTVWTWGVNTNGQLGVGSTTTQKFATNVTTLSGITNIACGSSHSAAVKSDGTVWSWGLNTNGQLGNGTTTQSTSPVQVKINSTTFFSGAGVVTAGASHTVILKTDGTVYACGLNSSGQLSINSTTQQLFPIQASASSGATLTNVIDLACGASHTVVTKVDGTILGGGLNSSGQAGFPTTTTNPTRVTPIGTFLIISAYDDPDGDGLPTWREHELGTNPYSNDTDNDQIPDSWEVNHGLNPLVNDAAADPDGDGFTNLQEYQNNTDPFDYFNGATFNLTVNSGSGQVGPAGMWLPQPLVVLVTNGSGAPKVNAPVTFSLGQISGGISTTSGGTPSSSLNVSTDSAGKATIYYQQGPLGDTPSSIIAQSGTGTIKTVIFTESTADIPTSGLKLWLNAEAGLTRDVNSSISLWGDQSASGNSAVQAILSNEPTYVSAIVNGKPVVRFNGLSAFMDGTLSLGSQVSMFVVASSGPNGGYKRIITNEFNFFMGTGSDGLFATFYGNGSAWGGTGAVSHGVGLTTGQFNILESVNNGTDSAYVNGLLADSRTNAMSAFSDGYELGRYPAGQYWDGDVAEILLYDRALSDSEKATVENYLNRRYNVVSSLPSAPTNLAGSAPTSAQVSLSWNVQPNVVFKVERKTGLNGTYATLATTLIAATSYIDNGLTTGAQYFYRIRAHNLAGDSSPSNEISITTPTSDADANGLLDSWEIQYFGHTGVDPNADPDGDGLTNLEEFQLGSNPTDPSNANLVSGGNQARFLSQVVITTMESGVPYHVSVKMLNSGTTTWSPNGTNYYALGIQDSFPNDVSVWGPARAYLSSSVASGHAVTFQFTARGPSVLGVSHFQWRMVQEGIQWFGEFSPNTSIQVNAAVDSDHNGLPDSWEQFYLGQVGVDPSADPDGDGLTNLEEYQLGTDPSSASNGFRINSGNSSKFISQNVPTLMGAGQAYQVSIKLLNNGTATWTQTNTSTPYALGIYNSFPWDTSIWGPVRVAHPADVTSGQVSNNQFTVIAPTTPGTYHFQWQMVQETIAWFGEASPDTVIQVGLLPPVAPTNLQATPISFGRVDLSWVGLGTGAISYKIERKTGAGGAYAQIGTTSGLTNYSDTTVSSSTQYYYRVKGSNAAGDSPFSNEVSVTTGAPPGIVTAGLSLWLKADAGVTNDANNAVTRWIDQSANVNDAVQNSPSTGPLLVANGLNGKPVVRFDGLASFMNLPDFASGFSQGEVFVIVRSTKTQPGANTLWVMGDDYIWNPEMYPDANGVVYETFGTRTQKNTGMPSQALDQFHLYNVSSKAGEFVSRMDGREFFRSFTNIVFFPSAPLLGAGFYSDHRFGGDVAEILIFNRVLNQSERNGIGTYLNQKYTLVTAAPPAPAQLQAYNVSSGQVSLSWIGPLSSSIVYYDVQRRTGSGDWGTIATVTNALSYIDASVLPSTQYSYRVIARDDVGASTPSAEASVTTLAAGIPIPLGDIKLWLKADEGVSSGHANVWTDSSGNFNDAVQFVSGTQPQVVESVLNGRPIVRFDGVDDSLNLPDFANGCTQGEVFVVLKSTKLTSGVDTLWFMGDDYIWGPSMYPSADGTILETFGTRNQKQTGMPSQDLSQFHLYNVSSKAGEFVSRINGREHFRTSNNTVFFPSAPILGGGTYADFRFGGDIAELVFFNRVLSDDERNTVQLYLNQKYAYIQTPPPTPAQVRGMALSAGQVNLSWISPISNASTLYDVQRRTGSDPFQTVHTVVNGMSYIDGAVAGATQYSYRIVARNDAGSSAASSEISVTTPVGGALMPVSDVKTWLKADEGVLRDRASVWVDNSGNHNNATQLTPSIRPEVVENVINGRPAVHFDGLAELFNMPEFAGFAEGEVFVVLSSTGTHVDVNTLWMTGDDYAWTPSLYPDNSGVIYETFGTRSQKMIGKTAQNLAEPHLYNVSSKTNEFVTRINGNELFRTDSNTAYFPAGPMLGGGVYSQHRFGGDVAEVIIFNRVLSPGERDRVQAYLADKYFIAGYDLDGDGLTNAQEVALGTDPRKFDTNGDGISDGLSVSLGINPLGSGYPWPPSPQPPSNVPLDFTLNDPPGAVLIQ
jgi:alpha-tubulin suppressor-like RCC1 family protein